jgi:uncharacterized protein YqjF (DUF2071 family)
MQMSWHDLLFAHWAVRPEALRPLIPAELEIDTFDGWAWIGVVPFRMSGVRPRYTPELSCTSAFPEINVRTYVKAGGRSGVWFFSLDATNRLAVRVARAWYSLPYFDARIEVQNQGDGVDYHSTRTHRRVERAEFRAGYRPLGNVHLAQAGTLDYWLTERYCLFASRGKGRVSYGDIHHLPWSLQAAEADISTNTMTDWLGIQLPATKPVLHFARELNVVAWNITGLKEQGT